MTRSIDDVRENMGSIFPGEAIAFIDPKGRVRIGTVRIKAVKCGKPSCSQCPHKRYAYAQYRAGLKVSEKYIGVI